MGTTLALQITVSKEVRFQELIAQKEAENRRLRAENERLSQEIKLLKEKIDLLIRRLFGSKSEKLDAAQLELLLKDLDLRKAAASAEKAKATPNVEALKSAPRASINKQRRERWPEDLAIEQEVIEPVEVKRQSGGIPLYRRRSHRDARLSAGEVFPTPDHSPQVRAPR
jgi:cell division protein FtsB